MNFNFNFLLLFFIHYWKRRAINYILEMKSQDSRIAFKGEIIFLMLLQNRTHICGFIGLHVVSICWEWNSKAVNNGKNNMETITKLTAKPCFPSTAYFMSFCYDGLRMSPFRNHTCKERKKQASTNKRRQINRKITETTAPIEGETRESLIPILVQLMAHGKNNNCHSLNDLTTRNIYSSGWNVTCNMINNFNFCNVNDMEYALCKRFAFCCIYKITCYFRFHPLLSFLLRQSNKMEYVMEFKFNCKK